jgi:hypothetical protein
MLIVLCVTCIACFTAVVGANENLAVLKKYTGKLPIGKKGSLTDDKVFKAKLLSLDSGVYKSFYDEIKYHDKIIQEEVVEDNGILWVDIRRYYSNQFIFMAYIDTRSNKMNVCLDYTPPNFDFYQILLYDSGKKSKSKNVSHCEELPSDFTFK